MTSDSDHTVRIRFQIPYDRIGIDEAEITYVPESGLPVILLADDPKGSIREARWLILKSPGWASEARAETAAELLVDALRMALARFGMAGDFGHRGPRSGVFRAGLEMISQAVGRPALNDIHGAMHYPTQLDPIFARAGTASVFRTVQPERWELALLEALRLPHELSGRERTACDLYCGAQQVRESQDARFVLLFATLETLLEETPRSHAAIEHLDQLIGLTQEAALPADERPSLLGSLRWLKSHSIRQAGKAFVEACLGEREYGDLPAAEFFLACYELRNRLLHGVMPFPSRDEVGALAAPLEQMMGHILAGPLLELDV